MGKKIKYAISKNEREFTPTPIVEIVTDDKGKDKEIMLMCAFGKKKKGDKLLKRLLNY